MFIDLISKKIFFHDLKVVPCSACVPIDIIGNGKLEGQSLSSPGNICKVTADKDIYNRRDGGKGRAKRTKEMKKCCGQEEDWEY